jgi:hypothetical protein
VWSRHVEAESPGAHRIDWPGTDASARRVAPGVYFAEINAGSRRASVKVVVLK